MAEKYPPISNLRSFAELSDELVRGQLERILQSGAFTNAPSLSRLLRHLVQQAIQGSASTSKEYAIGVEVFDRGESFDPRIDTIVRVQARRLRAKLDEYYRSQGQADPILIEVPKGRYVAEVRPSPHAHTDTKVCLAVDRPLHLNLPVAPVPHQPGRLLSLTLPAQRTKLIGRDEELRVLTRMLIDDGVRLVTLWGAGGAGKTRLAAQVISELTGHFPGGSWFVSLAGIQDARMVAPALAQTLELRQASGRPLALALQEHVHLTVTAPALLVIDNVEHVLEAAPLFGELLDASAALKILVTSRSVLHLYGEHEVVVPPLPTPDLASLPPAAELARNPAVALFVQRAMAVDPYFQLNGNNSCAVAEICARLDGLPLGIELAAARIRTLSPEMIRVRLEHRLELLTDGARDLHVRQQTLRNTVGWSYALLHPLEQKLFRRLAVFAGGCTLESAEAVCDAKRDLGIAVLDGISSLVANSLLYQREQTYGDSRFHMLETIREYALEQLRDSGHEAATRLAHAAYVLVIAEERTTHSSASGISAWVELCDTEQDNIRVALEWLIAADHGEWALRLGVALFHYWEAKEHLVEGRQRLQAILDMNSTAAATGARARVAFCAATFMASQCDYNEAVALFEHALQIYRELGDDKGVAAMLTAIGTARRLSGNDLASGRSYLEHALRAYRVLQDRPGIAGALSNLSDMASAQGDKASARALLQEAIDLFRELGDTSGMAWSFSRLGDIAYLESDWAEASRLYKEGLSIFRSTGERWGIARSYADLGHVACEQHRFEQAQSLFVRSLETLRDLGNTRGMARVFDGLACLAVYHEGYARALRLAGVAAGLRARLGASTRPDDDAFLQRKLHPAWEHLDAEQARTEWINGSRMPLDQAIRCALELPI